jgi:hypothetical protein
MVSPPSWLYQARHDSSISKEQVNSWATTLETELHQAVTRFDYAKLFGDLLDEWISSGDSLALPPAHDTSADGNEDESQSGAPVEKRPTSIRQGKQLLLHSVLVTWPSNTGLPFFSRTPSTAKEDSRAHLHFEAHVPVRNHLLLA